MIEYDLEKAVNDKSEEDITRYLDNYNFELKKNKDGLSLVHFLAQEGIKNILIEVIGYLKRKKNNYLSILNLVDNKGWTPLFSAIDSTESGLPDIVELLLKSGCEPNFKDPKGITPLHLAAYKGQDDNVEILIKYKAELNAIDNQGRTPIFLAIMEGQTNSIQALLDAGCEYEILDNNGDSLMHYSYYTKGNTILYVIILYEKGMNIDTRDKDNNTILILSALDGIKKNLRLIKKLIELGANQENKNNNNQSFNSLAYKEAMNNNQFVKQSNPIEKTSSHMTNITIVVIILILGVLINKLIQ